MGFTTTRTIVSARWEHPPSVRGVPPDDHVPMARHLLLAVLWGLVAYIWVSMSRLIIGIPDLGGVAAVVAAVLVIGRGYLLNRTRRLDVPSTQLVDDPS